RAVAFEGSQNFGVNRLVARARGNDQRRVGEPLEALLNPFAFNRIRCFQLDRGDLAADEVVAAQVGETEYQAVQGGAQVGWQLLLQVGRPTSNQCCQEARLNIVIEDQPPIVATRFQMAE